MTLESMGKIRSTPWPKLILRTVKLGCAPRDREMTTPSNACRRSFSPSRILTCTLIVSPGPNFGMSVRRDFANSFSIMGLRITFSFLTLALNLGQQFLVFRRQRNPLQQVGTVAQRFCQSRFAAPAANLVVVAVHQHFRYAHAAKIRGPRVMRIVEQSAGNAGRTRSIGLCGAGALARELRERLLPRRILVADRARNQPRNRVHNYRRTQFATAQHIVADRNFAIRQVLADAFVHAFVASADQHD